MKKILLSMLFLAGIATHAQVTAEPEDVDPTDSVKILININQFNAGLDHVQALLDAVAAGEDLYIWTWKPKEHGPAHPLTNGLGGAPWKNSNPALKLKNEGGGIYSFTMLPVDFYEVDASVVYDEDIHFLVKPQDGGGYGDPDRKSEDLVLEVNPPVTVRKPAFGFPSFVTQDDLYLVTYENKRETVVEMQNLGEGDCYLFSEATLTDSTVIRVSTYFATPSNPNLMMEYVGDQVFEKAFVPAQFFNLQPGQQIDRMRFVVMRKDALARTEDDIVQVLACP
jgi:hypothetical protein